MPRPTITAISLCALASGLLGCKSMVGSRPAARGPAPTASAAAEPAADGARLPTATPVAGEPKAAAKATQPAKAAAPPITPEQFEKAAMSYAFIDGKTGRSIDTPTAFAQLSSVQLVCIGEEHDDVRHHWAQRELVKNLSIGAIPGSLALGLEMVQAPFQGVLDDYEAKAIDVATFLTRSGWTTRWGYDFGFYQPILATAIATRIKLLALNAPRELTRRVVRDGLEALSADEKAQLPPIVALPAHETWFWQQMMGLGHPTTGGAEADTTDEAGSKTPGRGHRYYQVQEIWDETMAEGATKWLRLDKNRRVIVLAGTGHCHALGVPARAQRRGIKKIASVRPIVDASDDAIADEISSRQYDYLMILRKP
ncbi:MAG: ChaN family lipoprotein [Myxococcales bacterium]|nr:ChaN family lipoprotein [Myxococcales bacterium]